MNLMNKNTNVIEHFVIIYLDSHGCLYHVSLIITGLQHPLMIQRIEIYLDRLTVYPSIRLQLPYSRINGPYYLKFVLFRYKVDVI